MTKSYMRYSFLYRLPAIAACIFHFNLVYSQTPNPLPKTADSQLVIMHDASVNQMTDDTGLVKNMTWEKLHTLKVRERAHPEWGEQEIPLFAQVLELCKGKIYIYLDFKNADPAAAWREIVKRDTVISMNIRRR
jgi:glycerophosphoryl diester phosphodiesterase